MLSFWQRLINFIEVQIARGGVWISIGLIVLLATVAALSKTIYLRNFGSQTNATITSVLLTHTQFDQPSRYKVRYTFFDSSGVVWSDEEVVDEDPLRRRITEGLRASMPALKQTSLLFLASDPTVHQLADNFDPVVKVLMLVTGAVSIGYGLYRRKRTIGHG